VTFLQLAPGMMLYGLGFGLSIAQLTNVVLSDVSREKSGAAGGANNTARQVGFSIGIAIIGTLLSSAPRSAGAVDRVRSSGALSATVKRDAVAAIRRGGVTFVPPPSASAKDATVLHRLFVDAIRRRRARAAVLRHRRGADQPRDLDVAPQPGAEAARRRRRGARRRGAVGLTGDAPRALTVPSHGAALTGAVRPPGRHQQRTVT